MEVQAARQISFASGSTVLDDDICAALGERSAGKSRGRTGLDEVRVNGTVMALPYTVATVATQCNAGDGANWVAWDYF